MTTQKEYVERYNVAAQKVGKPSVKRFATIGAAKNRTEAAEAEAAKLATFESVKATGNGETHHVGQPTGAASKAKAARRPSAIAKIHMLVDKNPHRVGSKDHDKFKKLLAGATVAQTVDKGVDVGYINYAAKRNILKLV